MMDNNLNREDEDISVEDQSEDDQRAPASTQIAWGPRGTAAATIAAELTFENVSRDFDGHRVVKNLSLTIKPGQIVCLLGPSGCGKTTLLRMASGIERPSDGRILINGQEMSGPEKFVPPERRNIGLMFQDFALFPHLTVLDNVAFGLKGLKREEAEKVARAALQRVGLLHFADNFPHTLSGGEQQRVALARAVAPRPSVLLMDEPFSGLDPRLRDVMRKETLAVLRETRSTCILVTHHPEEAMELGDVIVVMRNGVLLQSGSVEELYHHPRNIFVARMFSAMNEFPVRVSNGGVETPFGRFDANGAKDSDTVMFCVRQRAVQFGDEGGKIGRVLVRKFLGDAALLEIAMDELDKPLLARVPEQDPIAVGDDVRVTIDPNMVLILKDD